jgi:Ca2+-binding RTX toxin-like protein
VLEGGRGDDIIWYTRVDQLIRHTGDGIDYAYLMRSDEAIEDFTQGPGLFRFDGASLETLTIEALTPATGETLLGLRFSDTDAVYIEGAFLDTGQTYVIGAETLSQRELMQRATRALSLTGTTRGDTLHGSEVENPRDARIGIPPTSSGDGDYLAGGAGDDVLYGYGGSDILDGGNNNDTLDGGAGHDNLRGQSGNDQLIGGAGNDALYGHDGTDTLDGGAGSDFLWGGEGGDTYLFGRSSESDTVFETDLTGSAIDTVQLDAGILPADITLHRNGNDLILAISGSPAQLTVSNYFITLTGYSDRYYRIEQVRFADGTLWSSTDIAARIQSGTPNAQTGTTGNDSFVVDDTQDTVTELAGQGTDTITSSVTYTLPDYVENLTLSGFLNLAATGNGLDNVITGNSGANVLNGGNGFDRLVGGAGDDVYRIYDSVVDTVIEAANEGLDTLVTRIGIDNLAANVENLIIDPNYTPYAGIRLGGNELDNVIVGARQSTTHLDGGAGADTLIGGEATDVYYVDNPGDIILDPRGGDQVYSSISYTLGSGLQRLVLTGAQAISGAGNAGNNVLEGNQNGAANTLAGGAGDDLYLVGDGDSVLENAGEGTDTVQIEQRLSDVFDATYSISRFANAENLTLGFWLDIANAIGDEGDNRLTGNGFNNILTGAGGNDNLNGGAGTDQLYGGAGNDLLYGDTDNDVLVGGAGNDTLRGWTGADLYRFGRGDGTDEIQEVNDFTAGIVDAIEFAAGVLPGEIVARRVDNSLLLGITGTSDLLRVVDYFATAVNTIEEVRFAGGTVWNRVYIEAHLAGSAGATEAADVLTGTNGDDVLSALGGDDILFGGLGNDTLDGGSGADQLYGGDGADTYIVDNPR